MIAHKNSGNTIAVHWRNTAVFISLLSMMVSLYISRAALSIAIIGFVVIALVNKDIVKQFRQYMTTPFFLALSLLFFIPFLSGWWSDDTKQWTDVVRIKLPLLFFPIAFAGNWTLSNKQWLIIAYAFLLIVFGGCVWGLIDYAQNTATIHENYLRAKTILTPLEDDHVRFSWLVSIAVILCTLLMQKTKRKSSKVFLVFLGLFFTIYLHILSARTGLLSLYIFFFLYAAWLLLRVRQRRWSMYLIILIVLLPLLAYFLLPTFRARIQYNFYDLSFAQKQEYLPGSSDGARTMSLRAGWQVLQQNPLGVGAGDIMHEADKWYAVHVPQVLPTDKFYPSSEWLLYGGFAGWPGVLLFTVIMLVPFFSRPKKHVLFWAAFHVTAAFSFAFDMGLEVQYGVFLYAFISCWWWKWLGVNGQS